MRPTVELLGGILSASSRDRVLVAEPPDGRDRLTLELEMAGDQVDGVRLIAMARRDEPAERARNRAAGFDAHVVKPVSRNRAHQTQRPLLAH